MATTPSITAEAFSIPKASTKQCRYQDTAAILQAVGKPSQDSQCQQDADGVNGKKRGQGCRRKMQVRLIKTVQGGWGCTAYERAQNGQGNKQASFSQRVMCRHELTTSLIGDALTIPMLSLLSISLKVNSARSNRTEPFPGVGVVWTDYPSERGSVCNVHGSEREVVATEVRLRLRSSRHTRT